MNAAKEKIFTGRKTSQECKARHRTLDLREKFIFHY